MHAFDENEKLLKFDTIQAFIAHYMQVRMAFYVKRKAQQIIGLEKETQVLSNKARFISELLDDSLDFSEVTDAEFVDIKGLKAGTPVLVLSDYSGCLLRFALFSWHEQCDRVYVGVEYPTPRYECYRIPDFNLSPKNSGKIII